MKISYLGGTKLRRSPRRALVAMLATVALLLVPASALAQQISPTSDQYDPKTSIVSEGPGEPGQPGQPSTSDQSSGGDLPFTGLDVGLLIAAAGLLGASGLVLRRLSASDRQ
jgi:hypothetical protein